MKINLTPAQPDSSLPHPKYRADIDGLRAIAVLSVVGFHAFPIWVKGGFIGVDVFFVISGYLISSIIFSSLDQGGFSFMGFYSRRIKRIFPALALVLAACYVFGWFILLPGEYKQLGKHIASGAGFVSNFVLWKESGYFDAASVTKPLLHLWSLGIEEQFYIAWPLLLYWVWKLKSNLLGLTALIAIASFWLNISKVHSDAIGAFYSPLTRFWELLVGSTLAYITLYRQNLFTQAIQRLMPRRVQSATATAQDRSTLRNIKSIAGFAFIAAAIFVLDKDMAFPGWWALLPTVGAYLLISAGSQAWLNRRVLSHRVLVWFGLISYPLYLWHWPLLTFARIVASETLPYDVRIAELPVLESAALPDGIRVAAILASIILAWLTYRFIERPIRFEKHSNIKTFSLCLLMLMAGFVGYYTHKSDGLNFRFPKIIQDISGFQYDVDKEYRSGTCFLGFEQDESAFGNCTDQPSTPASPSIILWGDSHAAHLYPGLKRVMGHDFKLTQLTAGRCPPILGLDISSNIHCNSINKYIISRIAREKPDRVILAAAWGWYPREDDEWKGLPYTVEQLRKAGVNRIDIVGPVPDWERDGLPKILYKFYKNDKTQHSIPQRMRFGLIPSLDMNDQYMQNLAAPLGVNYISALRILCNENGCLTRVGENWDSLTQYDNTHLTSAGSEFLVSHFPR